MLVIRRRTGQSLRIGADLEIEVLEAGSNKVKLGISGPRAIQVVRTEVETAVAANALAASISPEMRDVIVKKLSRISQAPGISADKNSESRCSGYPEQKENLDPA